MAAGQSTAAGSHTVNARRVQPGKGAQGLPVREPAEVDDLDEQRQRCQPADPGNCRE